MQFQPRIELSARQVIGVEALVRHRLNDRYDADTISRHFAASQRADVLTRHMLQQSISQLLALGDLAADWSLTLNLYASELLAATLPDLLWHMTEQAGFPLSRLILDIQDLPDAADSARILDVSNRLFLQGVRFAIDGPGGNYLEMERLMKLPFSLFKFDHAFIRGIQTRKHGPTLLKAQTFQAQGLGLTVVAEGVETQDELDAVTQAGCDHAQGHWFSPALPIDELEAWAIGFKSGQI